MKKFLSLFLVNFAGGFIGVAVDVLVTLYFKLPDHKVDVFAFVESALGIVLTTLALIVTLGVIKQRAEMETMLATKRDEIVEEAKIKLERDVFLPFKNDMEYKFMLQKQNVDAMKHSLDTASSQFIVLTPRIAQLEQQYGKGTH